MSPAHTDKIVACTSQSLPSDDILKVIALSAFNAVQKSNKIIAIVCCLVYISYN